MLLFVAKKKVKVVFVVLNIVVMSEHNSVYHSTSTEE